MPTDSFARTIAQSATFFTRQRGISAMADGRADPTGTTSSSAGLQTVCNAAAAEGAAVFLPKGTFKISSALTIPAGGLTIEGRGEESQLIANTANMNLITAVATGKVRLFNLRLVGDGTCSGYSNGILAYLRNCDVEADWLYLTGFGGHGVRADIDDAAHVGKRRIDLGVVRASEGRNPLDASSYSGTNPYGDAYNGNENADIGILGAWRSVTIGDFVGETSVAPPDGSIPVANGILIAQTVAGQELGSVQIGSINARGYRKRAVGIANNLQADNVSRGPVRIGSIIGRDIGWALIKTKFIPNLTIGTIVGRNIEDTAVADIAKASMSTAGWPNGYRSPEIRDNLQGCVLINGSENVTIASITIDGGGTDALRLMANWRGTGQAGDAPLGVGRYHSSIGQVIARGCGQAAVMIPASVTAARVESVEARDCGYGVRVYQSSIFAQQTDVSFGSIYVRDATVSGIQVYGNAANNTVGSVSFDYIDIDRSAGDGFLAMNVDQVTIGGGQSLNSGFGNPVSTSVGVHANGVGLFKVLNVRSHNTGSNVSQRTGFRMAGAMSAYTLDMCESGNNLGNAGGTSDKISNGNRILSLEDVSTGTVRKRVRDGIRLLSRAGVGIVPGAIPGGAIYTSPEVTMDGLELGDRVAVSSCTLQDDNYEVWAVTSSVGKYQLKIRNRSAGSLTPGTITYAVTATKNQNP